LGAEIGEVRKLENGRDGKGVSRLPSTSVVGLMPLMSQT